MTNAGHNGRLAPGQSTSFGFQGTGSGGGTGISCSTVS
ncbi:cellulose binding domain-containing protein [Winogradskya humida]|nr:cellulose binding domain-containing protein [Actinoplanes humidus]